MQSSALHPTAAGVPPACTAVWAPVVTSKMRKPGASWEEAASSCPLGLHASADTGPTKPITSIMLHADAAPKLLVHTICQSLGQACKRP